MYVPFQQSLNTMVLSVDQEIKQHEFGVHQSMLMKIFSFNSKINLHFSKTSFEQRAVLKNHTNFVIATCYIPSSDQFPDGLIVTGGNDKKICVYSAKQGTHLFTLEGHEQTGKDTFF